MGSKGSKGPFTKTYTNSSFITSWWFQPIWKIFVTLCHIGIHWIISPIFRVNYKQMKPPPRSESFGEHSYEIVISSWIPVLCRKLVRRGWMHLFGMGGIYVRYVFLEVLNIGFTAIHSSIQISLYHLRTKTCILYILHLHIFAYFISFALCILIASDIPTTNTTCEKIPGSSCLTLRRDGLSPTHRRLHNDLPPL